MDEDAPTERPDPESPLCPGALRLGTAPLELFAGRPTRCIVVRNTADRAVQVGSHVHFAQTNPGLEFDRAATVGWRLAIAAGTSVRFEPGIEREVTLVPLAGRGVVPGLRHDLPSPQTPGTPGSPSAPSPPASAEGGRAGG